MLQTAATDSLRSCAFGHAQLCLVGEPKHPSRAISCSLRGLAQVVKVLHGAKSDVEWLQRDFGIAVLNLFDTYEAARVLGLPQKGLGSLLQKYCSVQARLGCASLSQHLHS